MNDSRGKSKPTLESLLKDQQVITGKDLIKRDKETEKQKALLQEAIEFEQRNRRKRYYEFEMSFKTTNKKAHYKSELRVMSLMPPEKLP